MESENRQVWNYLLSKKNYNMKVVLNQSMGKKIVKFRLYDKNIFID